MRGLAEAGSAFRSIVALVLALALAGCGEKVPRLPAVGPNDVIVAFGDSLTYGTGANEDQSYPAVLARLINRNVVRSGVPGEMTAGGLTRLESVLDEHRPTLVILCLGGNDMLRKLDDRQIRNNLGDIIRAIKARGVAVVLVGVPKPALITSAPAFYDELAREFAVPYEGKVVTSVLYKPELKSDPIHPNAEGYRRMAEAIAELLRKAGAV